MTPGHLDTSAGRRGDVREFCFLVVGSVRQEDNFGKESSSCGISSEHLIADLDFRDGCYLS
jgi:hypothetical protein